MVKDILTNFIDSFSPTTVAVIVGVVVVLCVVVCVGGKRKKRRRHKRFRSPQLAKIDKMAGEEFEDYLAYELKKEGFKTKTTPVTGDFGADIIIVRNKRKTAVQVKRYSNPVGIAAVQEAIGAKAYYDADDAAVMTNSYYTYAAKELAKKANVKLVDRNDLIRHIEKKEPFFKPPKKK